MTHAKKTFGQHIESAATYLGDSIHKTVIDSKNHELEDWKLDQKLGFISDEEKLKSLKRCLYEAATVRANSSEDIQNLTRAIATISEQLEAERRHRNSPVEVMFSLLNSTILLGVVAAILSFPMAWSCNFIGSQSEACSSFRIIPSATTKFFSEPK